MPLIISCYILGVHLKLETPFQPKSESLPEGKLIPSLDKDLCLVEVRQPNDEKKNSYLQ